MAEDHRRPPQIRHSRPILRKVYASWYFSNKLTLEPRGIEAANNFFWGVASAAKGHVALEVSLNEKSPQARGGGGGGFFLLGSVVLL